MNQTEVTDKLVAENVYDTLIDEFTSKEVQLKTGKRILIELSVVDLLKLFENPSKFEDHIFIKRETTMAFYARLNMFFLYVNNKMPKGFLTSRTALFSTTLKETFKYDELVVEDVLNRYPTFVLLFDVVNRYVHLNQYS